MYFRKLGILSHSPRLCWDRQASLNYICFARQEQAKALGHSGRRGRHVGGLAKNGGIGEQQRAFFDVLIGIDAFEHAVFLAAKNQTLPVDADAQKKPPGAPSPSGTSLGEFKSYRVTLNFIPTELLSTGILDNWT